MQEREVEVSGDSALGRVFREGVMEERPKEDEGSECVDIGGRGLPGRGNSKGTGACLRQEAAGQCGWSTVRECEETRSESKG